MNQYLEKLEKIAAYRDDVMYMRTPLGRNGAGPNSPAIYAANQRARFGMSQEDRDLIRERNALRRAEREGMLGSRKATFSELEAMVANRKAKDNLARSAYDRHGIQNRNGPILNLTKTPIKSHPAMGPTGLRTVKYEGNWPVNPLSVPSMDVDYKTITQKGEVLNKLKEKGPVRRIAAAQTVADTVSHSSPGLSTGAKIGLGAVGLGGLGLAAYAIHQHNQHQNEKRASEEDMNQYLEKIAAWHPNIFNTGSASQLSHAKDSLRLMTDRAKKIPHGYDRLREASSNQRMVDLHRGHANRWKENAHASFNNGVPYAAMEHEGNRFASSSVDMFRNSAKENLGRAREVTEKSQPFIARAAAARRRAIEATPSFSDFKPDLRNKG